MAGKQKKIIIGLVGEIVSGKGAVAKYLAEKYQADTMRFSTILRDILKRIYLESNRANMQLLSTILRKNFGEDTMARVIAQEVKESKNKIIAVDGIRRLADISHLNEMPNFILVKIETNKKIRYQRMLKRNENPGEAGKTYKEFLADHKKEADREVPEVMNKATYKITNNGSLKELYKKINQLIDSLKINK